MEFKFGSPISFSLRMGRIFANTLNTLHVYGLKGKGKVWACIVDADNGRSGEHFGDLNAQEG